MLLSCACHHLCDIRIYVSPGHESAYQGGYACLIPVIENIPFGYWTEKHPLFCKRQRFFYCDNCTLFQIPRSGCWEEKLETLFRQIKEFHLAYLFSYLIYIYIKCTLFDDFMRLLTKSTLMILQR